MKITEDLTQFANFAREDDEYDGKMSYGVHLIDGDEIMWTEWFETEAEREELIDEFYKQNSYVINTDGTTETDK